MGAERPPWVQKLLSAASAAQKLRSNRAMAETVQQATASGGHPRASKYAEVLGFDAVCKRSSEGRSATQALSAHRCPSLARERRGYSNRFRPCRLPSLK